MNIWMIYATVAVVLYILLRETAMKYEKKVGTRWGAASEFTVALLSLCWPITFAMWVWVDAGGRFE